MPLELVLGIVAVGALAFGASMLIQWTSHHSAAFSIGVAVAVVLVLALGALLVLRTAAARLQ